MSAEVATTTALRANGLGKRYGRTWALRDCSLELPVGRIAALVGPNGAGKTTVLQPCGRAAATDHRIGPGPGLGPDGRSGGARTRRLRRSGHAAVPRLHAGGPDPARADAERPVRRAARVRALATARDPDRPDSPEALGRPAGAGGARDRARETAVAPAARQPVASLDPLARREFLQVLAGSVAEEGLTVVLSSHLLPDLERLCDHLIVLSSSRVQVLGSVEDLLAEHKVLVGPRRDGWEGGGLGTIVQEQHTERQTTVLVRTSGPVSDPSWVVHDVSLEELVLAYLGHPEAGALPGPDRAIDGGATR